MPGFDGVFFLEAADLAVAKLHAGRPKDIEVLVHLLKEGLLDAQVVRARLDATPLREVDIVKLYAVWERVLHVGGSGWLKPFLSTLSSQPSTSSKLPRNRERSRWGGR